MLFVYCAIVLFSVYLIEQSGLVLKLGQHTSSTNPEVPVKHKQSSLRDSLAVQIPPERSLLFLFPHLIK